MSDSINNISETSLATNVKTQYKQRLSKFFENKQIKNLVSILAPGILAAALFPFFGHALAIAPGVIAIQNSLKLVGISFSTDTIQKLLQLFQGKVIGESDLQEALQEILPQDKQLNNEAAKTIVTLAPEIKKAALANSKIDADWLGKNLEISLKQQGETMAEIASEVGALVRLDENALKERVTDILANWPTNTQDVTATKHSKVTESEQNIEGKGGVNKQFIRADDDSEISHSKQNIKLM